MKILDVLGESLRTERISHHTSANMLRDLYDERRDIKRELNDARITGDDEDVIADLVQQLSDIDANIQQLEGGVTEAKNHMGDREYQTYGSWKSACKKVYPGCTFRGDKDIGAAVVANGHDVGEWDGAIGTVYNKESLKESVGSVQFSPREVEYLVSVMHSPTEDISPDIMDKLMNFYSDEMPYGTQKARSGDPYEWIADRLSQIYDKFGDEGIRNEFNSVMESQHDRDMIASMKKALKVAKAKLAQMKEDLHSLKNAARTEDEHDAVRIFKKSVDLQERLTDRLQRRIKLRKAVVKSGLNESVSKWEKYDTDELFDIVSDYHKDVYGFRPRNIDTREKAIAELNALDRHMEREKSTPEGRERLRADGWSIED